MYRRPGETASVLEMYYCILFTVFYSLYIVTAKDNRVMYNAGSDTAPPVPTSPGYPPQPLADYPQQPLADYPPQPLADYPPQHPPDYPPQPIPPSYAPPQQAGYPPPQQTSQQTSNTTVIIQQPQAEVVLKGPEQWSSGLFDIFDDCGLCTLIDYFYLRYYSLLSRDVHVICADDAWSKANDNANYYFKIFTCT